MGLFGQSDSDIVELATNVKILQMQQVLNVPQTGEVDATTRAALKEFQVSRGLPATGFPDADTLRALGESGADVTGMSSLPSQAYLFWSAYKWWIVGGAVVLVGGGLLLWGSRRRR